MIWLVEVTKEAETDNEKFHKTSKNGREEGGIKLQIWPIHTNTIYSKISSVRQQGTIISHLRNSLHIKFTFSA